MDWTATITQISSAIMESCGVVTIVLTALFSPFIAFARLYKKEDKTKIYVDFRRSLGRGILLGLEFLVAADIIRSVAVQPTLRSVTILASIVIIRTFLSFTLEVEMNGKWPWQSVQNKHNPEI